MQAIVYLQVTLVHHTKQPFGCFKHRILQYLNLAMCTLWPTTQLFGHMYIVAHNTTIWPCIHCGPQYNHLAVYTLWPTIQTTGCRCTLLTADDAGDAIRNDGSWGYPHASHLPRLGYAISNASYAQRARHVPCCAYGIPRDAHGALPLWLHDPWTGGRPHADGVPDHVWCFPAEFGDAVCDACHEPGAADAAAASAPASDGQQCQVVAWQS